MLGYSKPFSYSPGGQAPRGFFQDDFPQQRKPYMYDEPKVAPPQRNGFSRPNGRSIYMQRKEYSETLNKKSENLHVRVEHLFTCELDGKELKTMDDCLAKLKRLDGKGRLWPQQMIMEVQGGYLVLSDIETKAELDVLPFSNILNIKAVLDSCAYDSVLAVTVQERFKRNHQVYLYQCEETGAEEIKKDLDKFIQERGADTDPDTDKFDLKLDLENIMQRQTVGKFKHPEPVPPLSREDSPTMWKEPENMAPPRFAEPRSVRSSPEVSVIEQKEAELYTDIFNHIVEDLEIFLQKISSALSHKEDDTKKSSNKNVFKKKKSVKKAAAPTLPPCKEYVANLQKVKYGFNLLAQLDGRLKSPNAQDYVHILFTILQMTVPRYPPDLPSTVISPLLTLPALRLLSRVVSPEEEQLWRSLGDSWSVPRSKWPDDVPPYIPELYSGWQPPTLSYKLHSPPSESSTLSRTNSTRFAHDRSPPVELILSSPPHSPSPPPPFSEPPLHMRVIYDFTARNHQELSVMKGEVVQVIQKSKQWSLVRNNSGEEGNIPHNVLEPVRGGGSLDRPLRDTRGGVNLNMSSSPAEVRAWLEHKGFSRLTVTSLGVLSGKLLLGMTKDELRTVCPQEGSKVFFQLQAVKSSIALANEQPGMYNGRY